MTQIHDNTKRAFCQIIQAEGENTEFCNKACFRTEHIRKHSFAIRGCRLKRHIGGITERLKRRGDPFFKRMFYPFSIAYYNSDGISKWNAVLTGSFSYNGSSATCSSSSVDVTIFDSDWYVISKYASKSGNTATASVTVGRRYDGSTIKVPVSLSLKCDKNGNLS